MTLGIAMFVGPVSVQTFGLVQNLPILTEDLSAIVLGTDMHSPQAMNP